MSRLRTPIVVVLGATGAGKSKLALQLAEKYKGEIISADAMQMYKGLDIVTNKVTPEELSRVKHHMIDFYDPLTTCTIVDFKKKALPILKDLLDRGVIPFICGGTTYYIESLLWKVLVLDEEEEEEDGNDEDESEDEDTEAAKNHEFSGDDNGKTFTNEELYERLKEVDPARVEELLPSERRKVYRSLQIYYTFGRPHSEILNEQRMNGSAYGGGWRFDEKDICFIWVQSEKEILDERCDKRVDKMIQRGMLKELEDFHKEYNSKRTEPADYTRGIFQSIGFKEFHSYLILDEEEKKSAKGQKLYEEGVKRLKIATHQYSRRQMRWINRRLLNPMVSLRPKIYAVDSSDPSLWDKKVLEPSVKILEAFIEGKTPEQEPVPLQQPKKYSTDEIRKIFHCEKCDRSFMGLEQYEAHLASRKHKKGWHPPDIKKKKNRFTLILLKSNKQQNESKLELLKQLKELTGKNLEELRDLLEGKGQIGFDFDVSLTAEAAKKWTQNLATFGIEVDSVKLT